MIRFSVAIAPDVADSAPVLYRGDIFASLEKAKAAGFDAVEIHLQNPDQLDPTALMQRCGSLGLRISAVATGLAKLREGLCFIHDDAAVREKAVNRILSFIEWSVRTGAMIVVGSMRGSIPDMKNRARYDERFYECMARILSQADAAGVTILLELINRYENNYLNTAAEFLEYTKPIRHRSLMAHLDTFHMNIEEASMTEAIRISAPYYGYMHFADNNRRYMGAGSIDFKPVVQSSIEAGYDGYFALECLPLPTPEEAVAHSMEVMNALYKRH